MYSHLFMFSKFFIYQLMTELFSSVVTYSIKRSTAGLIATRVLDMPPSDETIVPSKNELDTPESSNLRQSS